ncbi:type 1 glutamine amidotransferase [Thermoleophilia bacterium SCSIO 60948]|nr:type 1 glutamine amidotransferase [Thermoleophilia bacterium SCSIO 60948]
MAEDLSGKKIAILVADGFEQVEYDEPKKAVEDAGATTELLSIDDGEVQAMNGEIDKGDTYSVDKLVGDASVDDYAGLILPGGVANPDNLRADENATGFVRDFFATGKPVGVICHGPWTLIDAGVAEGRTMTSFPSIRTDLRNAGATVVDEEVVTDAGLVSSRNPDDLPAFCAKIVEEFAEGAHEVADAGATAG